MDHHYIEEHNIPDRYLQGKLSSAERTRFEEHFIDCAECLDRLEMTEDFRRTLRTVAAEQAMQSRVYARTGLLAWLTGLSGMRQAALLAASILLLVALPSALLITETGRSRREANEARLSSADWRRRYEESQQTARNLEKEMQAREQESSRRRLELETQLKQERQARGREDVTQLALLQPAAPIFDLNIVRSSNAGQSAKQISIPSSSAWIVLKLEIEPDPEIQSYRATLLTSDQQIVWRASDLAASKGGLAITLNTSLIRPSDYRLTLEGLNKQGGYVSAGAYSFRVIKQ
jgi:hypothetical protein